MGVVDLVFGLRGETIPAEHGWPLFGAVSRLVPGVHGTGDKGGNTGGGNPGGVGIFPIAGRAVGDGLLALAEHSVLRVRTPAERIPELLPLAGKVLDVAGRLVTVGVPRVVALVPAPTLRARMVIIKVAGLENEKLSPEAFLGAARKQLAALEIVGELGLAVHPSGPRAGEPQRRVLHVRGKALPGYSVVVTGLSAAESIRLQEAGIGGRRAMGCGLFQAVKEGQP